MTNQEKQQQKELANKVTRETARLNDRTYLPNLSEEEQDAIKNFPNMLDRQFRHMVDSETYSPKELCELLYPFLRDSNIASKIGMPLCCEIADRRHVNLKLMAAMRRVFGISIDKLLDECFQYLPDREPPKK